VHADPNMSNPAPRAAVQALLRPGIGSAAVPATAVVLLILMGFQLLSLKMLTEAGHRLSLLRRHRVRMAPGRLKTART
jgi:hypothetical protein